MTSETAGPLLFVSYSGLWGGAERILVDIAGGLERPAVLLCPAGALAARAAEAGIPVLARPDRPRELRGGARTRVQAALGLVAHAHEIRMEVASLRPSVVVAWGMRSAIAAAAALACSREPPPVVFEHVDFLPSEGVARVVRAAAARAQRVIALSSAVATDLDPRGRLGARLTVVAPGVDLEHFGASPPPTSPPVALTLGAITPWKRPDLALEAVALASRELPELRLIVAGHSVGEVSERLLEDLQQRAAQPDLAGRVEFAGALDDPRPALKRASCLLHCSDREPFGLVLLEAMASGRPVLAPAAGGPPEIVAGGCGRLFSPGDAGAAAYGLIETLGDGDRLRHAGERARAHVAQQFALPVARRRWLETLPPTATNDEAGSGLTLVTVSHDSERELHRLLASAQRHLPAAAVVVVDSGSRDGSVEVARRQPERVSLRELDNLGYGRAVNAGLALVATPACVILNPDVELVDDSLAGLAAEALRPGAQERLLAPLVLHPDGTRQDSVHPEPLSWAALAVALLPPAALPPVVGRRVQPWRGDRPEAVAWAVGCCVAGRTDTLRRLGPFDERIFLYAEDMELGLRARDAGVQTWWWPTARVIHHQAHSTQRAFGGEPFELLARQRHAVIAERRGERAARWDDRLQAALLINRIALKTLLARPSVRERRQLRALGGARGAQL
jgi:GT2 family glycosyltransferase/glycosyltransferase involved in cell wall biosynthesis